MANILIICSQNQTDRTNTRSADGSTCGGDVGLGLWHIVRGCVGVFNGHHCYHGVSDTPNGSNNTVEASWCCGRIDGGTKMNQCSRSEHRGVGGRGWWSGWKERRRTSGAITHPFRTGGTYPLDMPLGLSTTAQALFWGWWIRQSTCCGIDGLKQ